MKLKHGARSRSSRCVDRHAIGRKGEHQRFIPNRITENRSFTDVPEEIYSILVVCEEADLDLDYCHALITRLITFAIHNQSTLHDEYGNALRLVFKRLAKSKVRVRKAGDAMIKILQGTPRKVNQSYSYLWNILEQNYCLPYRTTNTR